MLFDRLGVDRINVLRHLLLLLRHSGATAAVQVANEFK